MRNEGQATRARSAFIAAWALLALAKLALATRLPLFVDEAFYWQEGRHLAWAYSDLPGLTAWLARLGVEAGGTQALALRAPFLLLAACIPWQVVRIARLCCGQAHAWHAGLLACVLPLAGALGLLAVPDVALSVASLLCVEGGARMLRRVDAAACTLLAAGLVLGALCHYRFIAVIGVGFLALLSLPEGRRALRDPRAWGAIAAGALAWWPLLAWNLAHGDAGLRFQLVDRHPWAFHPEGIAFVPAQWLLVTPLLFPALLLAAWRGRADATPVRAYLARLGGMLVAGFFLLGFFADSERISFHWPLPGYLALLPLVPAVLARWPGRWRRVAWALAAVGLALVLGWHAAVATPALRARMAAHKWYPSNFAGWQPLAAAVRAELARMPPGTRLVADNFKLGAELGFALDDPRIDVLPHPLNGHHGRAPQLALWGLLQEGALPRDGSPVLLVVSASELPYRELLAHYHALCARVGPLPPPRVVPIDHGRQRFLLFALPPQRAPGACTLPAMAWIDTPLPSARVAAAFDVAGWAFKDGVGIAAVEVVLDGRVVARARHGLPMPGVAAYWRISTDPDHPRVGFRARVDARGLAPGRHWLGLRLHGRDGSVEAWPEQPVHLAR